jgi:hypothetical protein
MSQTVEGVSWGMYDRDACENAPRKSIMEQHIEWINRRFSPLPDSSAAENPRTPIGEPAGFCCGEALQESDYGYGPGHWWTVCPRCGDIQVYGGLTAG